MEIWKERPNSSEHFSRLLAFCQEIMVICHDLSITPVLSGSLAVLGYTGIETMKVNDIDLACSEREFPRLSSALGEKGIAHEVKPWHVLQARRDDLKVEFDSLEYWMTGIPQDYHTLVVGGMSFRVVSLSSLRELYRRGLEATVGDEADRAKHRAIAEKYEALRSLKGRYPLWRSAV